MNKKKIEQYIDQEKLFTREDKILVTLSGGADSVALLRLLLDMGYTCEAAHCNFHLRGDESVRDEMFVTGSSVTCPTFPNYGRSGKAPHIH